MSVDEIKYLKVAQFKCKQSLLFFTRYFFKKRFNRNFVIGEHHIKICEALEKVYAGEITRLIINIAPRYGKTELAVKNFIAHGLALNPAARFIHLSYSDALSLDNSSETKEFITSAEYSGLFPDVVLKKDSYAKNKWYTTEGGGVYATSSSGQVTGFGAGRVDIEDDEAIEISNFIEQKEGFSGAIIIDDPVKPEDANSDLLREKVNSRFDSTIVNRVNSRKTPIIIIMQRLHPNDLCGYVTDKKPGEWTVLSLPAIKEDGTALWEFKHTLAELNEMWLSNSIVFESQYLQNPKPKEGLLYKTLKVYDVLPVGTWPIKSVIDTADTGDDFLCCIDYVATPTGYYIIDVLYTQAGMETTENETAVMLTKDKVMSVKIESNNGGRGFARNVETNCRILGNNFTAFKWYHQTENKQVRIFNHSNEVQNMVYFPKHLLKSKFYMHVSGFLAAGRNLHDDAEDALTMVVENEGRKGNKLFSK
jgi:predicted phage terminase large subunit-like protein